MSKDEFNIAQFFAKETVPAREVFIAMYQRGREGTNMASPYKAL